jgi:hypothetical protein
MWPHASATVFRRCKGTFKGVSDAFVLARSIDRDTYNDMRDPLREQ